MLAPIPASITMTAGDADGATRPECPDARTRTCPVARAITRAIPGARDVRVTAPGLRYVVNRDWTVTHYSHSARIDTATGAGGITRRWRDIDIDTSRRIWNWDANSMTPADWDGHVVVLSIEESGQ